MLGLLKDPSERIFCEKEKDKYLSLQKLLKVDYKYRVINNMVSSLKESFIFDMIRHNLNWVTLKETK